MFARLFRVTLKPFASPAPRISLRAFESAPPSAPAADAHSDYDRHPLRIHEFDHLVEGAADSRRFNVH